MEDQFDKLDSLRNRTISQADCDKILDAMLKIGSYEQLDSLRNRTISQADCDKILDAMLLAANRKPKKAQNASVLTQLDKKQYDVFIAHASEDKDFGTPLALSLRKKGLKVWYDDFVLRIGDSLRREIDKGLAKSRYGVVILSHNFFNKHWPQKELDGLAAKEQLDKKVILPIWHNIEKEEIVYYSPTLADIIAVKSSLGVEVVAKKIYDVVKRR